MRKFYLLLIMFSLLSGFAQAEVRTCTASFCSQYPVIDGKIDQDPAWTAAAWSSDAFFLHRKKAPPQLATRFKFLYTEDALYLAVECSEPEAEKLKPVYNFGEFWNYDNVEVFFHPKPGELIQLVGNYQGMKQDVIDETVAKRTGFKTGWSCAATLTEDRWFLELCIPFYLLGVAPVRQDLSIPFNLCRTSVSCNERSTWSFQSGAFKNVKDFGRLVLKRVPADRADKLAAALQRPHWNSLLERWQAIRKDLAWKEVFERHPNEVVELEQKTTGEQLLAPDTERVHQLLSILEKDAEQQDELHRKRIMKRLFDE